MELTVEFKSSNVNRNVGLALVAIYIFTSFNAVDLLISSSYNSFALYALIGWSILAWLLSDRTITLDINAYTCTYIIFMLISLATMLYSPEKKIFESEFYLMLVSIIVSISIGRFVTDKKSFELLCWIYSISSFFLTITLLSKGMLIGTSSERLGESLFGNANIFAMLFMMASIYQLWLLVYSKIKLIWKLLLVVMTAGNFFVLIFSSGKKYFIIPLIFLYLLLVYKKDDAGRRHFIMYSIIAIAAVAGIAWLLLNVEIFYQAIGSRLESFFNGLFFDSNYYNASDLLRSKMRTAAIERWSQSPVWGYGFDSFKYYALDKFGRFYYSHCNYTELLYNGGVILFVLYYMIYFNLYRALRKNQNAYIEFKAFAFAILISFLIFDYGAVSYSSAGIQTAIFLAYRCLSFEEIQAGEEIDNEQIKYCDYALEK